MKGRLEAMWFYRRMQRISWMGYVSNEEVSKNMETKSTHSLNHKETVEIFWTHKEKRDFEEFDTRKTYWRQKGQRNSKEHT